MGVHPDPRNLSAFADLGPTTPGRGEIYRVAREVEALARLARELTIAGPQCDPARAARQLDRARALLGVSTASTGSGQASLDTNGH